MRAERPCYPDRFTCKYVNKNNKLTMLERPGSKGLQVSGNGLEIAERVAYWQMALPSGASWSHADDLIPTLPNSRLDSNDSH